MSDKKHVALLFGGRSTEHEVSLTSARSILQSADREKYNIIPVLITKKGQWFLVEKPDFLIENKSKLVTPSDYKDRVFPEIILDYTGSRKLIGLYDKQVMSQKIDVVFPILHGPYGEDGTVQGLCKLAGIPCVGAGILGSSVGLDKVAMKHIFVANKIPTLEFLHFSSYEWQTAKESILKQVALFPFPLFVKPANAGSSIGVSKVHSQDELEIAIDKAFQVDRKILLEKAVDAREIECAILGNYKLKVSKLGEVIPSNEFYDYEAKYLEDASKTIIPDDIDKQIEKKIKDIAAKAFLALDCYGFSRVDFLLERGTNTIYLNEINTIPGFTPISMYPMLWKACGISYSELISQLIELAIEMYEMENK